MSTIWITGARGFIGRHLASYLSREGQVVLGLGHGAWPEDQFRKWGVSFWLNGDIEASNLQQLLSQSGCPEAIYHLAGGSAVGTSFVSPLEDFSRTVDSTARLLDWIRRYGMTAKTICVSSAAVYGAGHHGPIAGNTSLSPYSPYGFHKAIMETLCRSYAANFDVKVGLVRFFSIYGSGLEKQLLWDICRQLSADPYTILLSGTGREIRDWIHVSDAVRLLWQMRDHCHQNALTVNGGQGWVRVLPISCRLSARPGAVRRSPNSPANRDPEIRKASWLTCDRLSVSDFRHSSRWVKVFPKWSAGTRNTASDDGLCSLYACR